MFQIGKGNVLLLKGSKYYFSSFFLKVQKKPKCISIHISIYTVYRPQIKSEEILKNQATHNSGINAVHHSCRNTYFHGVCMPTIQILKISSIYFIELPEMLIGSSFESSY